MSDNKTRADNLEMSMLAVASAGGHLVALEEITPAETAACGFDTLHAAVDTAVREAPDDMSSAMLVGMIAAGCMVDLGIKKPTAPPTVDGAFGVFSDWAHMEGRSLADLKRVFGHAHKFSAEVYVIIEMMVEALRLLEREEDSNARQHG